MYMIMNKVENIYEIKKNSIALYRERYGELQMVGSGLLLKYQEKNLLISAFHVIDMEDERIEKENADVLSGNKYLLPGISIRIPIQPSASQ